MDPKAWTRGGNIMSYKDLLKKQEDETNQMVKEDKILYFIGNEDVILKKMEDKGVQQDQLVYVGAGAYIKKEYYDEVNAMFDRHVEEQRQYALSHTYEVVQHYLWDYEIEISLSYTYEDAIYKLVGLTKDEAQERAKEIDQAIKDYKREFYEIN